jgi:putative ABC transport system ATP-binding protein
VRFAALAAGGAAEEAFDPARALALVGLSNKRDALPAELSGGEQQRVAIARAIAATPDLLLCDEPTGQLDSDTGRRVLDLIGAVQAEVGFALVIATHDEEIANRIPRVVELSAGRIVRDVRR